MQRKTHNQTLFVAALSVYLGLLIVGAPPHVLALTSKTIEKSEKVFIAQKELQSLNTVKRKNESGWLSLSEAFNEFFDAVKNNSTIKSQFDFDSFEFEISLRQAYVIEDCPPPLFKRIDSKNLNKNLETELADLASSLFFFRLAERTSGLIHISANGIDLRLSPSGIELETIATLGSKNQNDVVVIAGDLRNLYQSKVHSGTPIERLIYSNAEVSAKYNQIFVVTRLPRAALDSLLKANEKAN